MVAKKPEHEKEKEGAKEPKHEKERVKKLIEEKMEKIRKQELGREKGAPESVGEKPEKEAKEKPAAKKDKETEGGKSRLPSKSKPLPASVFVTGKRKRAIARAFFKTGKGVIKVNSIPIDLVMPDMFRLKMMEPLMVIGDEWKRFDGKITVTGGGPSGQADAVRQVIARGLSELLGPEARKAFLSYDRNLIVYDSRRTEPHKPPHSSWGPRRYKQRSKR
jgi:small subunit ribosomal protein S9